MTHTCAQRLDNGFYSVFPEIFSWKLRVLCQKVTKITSQKAQNNGLITSFYTKISRKMTLPTLFIAFLSMNFFKVEKIENIFQKKNHDGEIFFLKKLFLKNILVWPLKRNFLGFFE